MSRIKRTYLQLKSQINELLMKHNLTLRIDVFSKNILVLNNGRTILKHERAKFLQRAFSVYFTPYLEQLYPNPKNINQEQAKIKEIKSLIAKISGSKADSTKFMEYVSTKGRPSPLKGGKFPNRKCWCRGQTKKTDARLQAISDKMCGQNNPSIKYYSEIFTPEYKTHHSNKMKSIILSGDFTPQIKNTRTHFDSICMGKKFRSSWEAVFYYRNQNLKYEDIRLTYFDSSKKTNRIYILDFTNDQTKTIYEIKPKMHQTLQNFQDKLIALQEYCVKIGWKYKLISEDDIYSYVKSFSEDDYDNFDQKTVSKLKKFLKYETNKKNRNNPPE